MVVPARPIGGAGDVVEPELPAAIAAAREVCVQETPNRQSRDDDRDDDRQLPDVRADSRPELIAPVPQRVEEVLELEPARMWRP